MPEYTDEKTLYLLSLNDVDIYSEEANINLYAGVDITGYADRGIYLASSTDLNETEENDITMSADNNIEGDAGNYIRYNAPKIYLNCESYDH